MFPKGHVVMMGTPGSGRSAVIEGLSRVLDPDLPRRRTADEFDFYAADTSSPAEVHITLSDLGDELEQHFFDHLEIWDADQGLVKELQVASDIDSDAKSLVLRLAYRAEWIAAEERIEEFVYYPKNSDPPNEIYDRARLADIEMIGYSRIAPGRGRALSLRERSAFRRLTERASGDDFGTAVEKYREGLLDAAKELSSGTQIREAIGEVLKAVAGASRLGEVDPTGFQFAPDGGARTALLRALTPTVALGTSPQPFPTDREGSTLTALLTIAETLALAGGTQSLLAIDDLGDAFDAGSAAHVASIVSRRSHQSWITTRVPAVAEMFGPDEVFRFSKGPGGEVFAHQGRSATNKAERIAAKHWNRSILPALTYESAVIVEGPDDLAAVQAIARRLLEREDYRLPATRGVVIVSAAAAGSGGSSAVPKVADLCTQIGLWTVAIIDHDKNDADEIWEKVRASTNYSVRFPASFAIERALLDGIDDDVLREALTQLANTAGLPFAGASENNPSALRSWAIDLLKKTSGGLHALFVDLLPIDHLPPTMVNAYKAAVEAAANRNQGNLDM